MPLSIRLLFCAVLLIATAAAAPAQEYFTVHQIDQAKAEARTRHLPIAWMSSFLSDLDPKFANAQQGSEAELTQLALRALQDQAVVIFQNGDPDLPFAPPLIQNQIEAMDEGPIPGGWHYHAPKIIYTDPEITTYLDHTLAPEIKDERETAIASALSRVHHNPAAQALIVGGPAKPALSSPAPAATPAATDAPEPSLTEKLLGDFAPYLVYIAVAVVFLIVLMGYLAWRGRPTANPPRQY